MNGRIYDPLTAQFYSPDPFIQQPDNWVNYNRYSYCFGNPLIYTDPSGYKLLPADEGRAVDAYFSWATGRDFMMDFSNQRGAGGGNTSYTYNWDTGNYYNQNGEYVNYWEVYNNYILPNSVNDNKALEYIANIFLLKEEINRQLGSIANDAASRVAGIVAKTNAQWNGIVNGIDKYLGNTCKGVVNVYNVLFGYNYENNVGFVNVSMNGQPYFSERFISSAAQTTSFMGSYFEHYKGSSALSTFESGVVRSGKAIDKINIGIDYYKLFNNPSVENGINLGLDIISKKNFTIGWFTFWGTEVAPWAIEEVNQDGYRSRDIRQLLEEQY